MDLLDRIVRIAECEDPSCGFRLLVEALAAGGSVRAAFWSSGDDSSGGEWPEGDPLARELRTGGAGAREPHGPRLLLLPLPVSGGSLGLLGAGGDPPAAPGREPLARSFDQLLHRHARLEEALRITESPGLTLGRAETLEEIGRLRREQGRSAEARAALAEARSAFRAVGALRDVARLGELLGEQDQRVA